jgi:hypothetical protein
MVYDLTEIDTLAVWVSQREILGRGPHLGDLRNLRARYSLS